MPSVGAAACTAATAAIPARLRPAAPSPPSGLASLASAGAGSASSGSPRPPCVRTASGSPVRCPEPGFCWFLGTRGGSLEPHALLDPAIPRDSGLQAGLGAPQRGTLSPKLPPPRSSPSPASAARGSARIHFPERILARCVRVRGATCRVLAGPGAVPASPPRPGLASARLVPRGLPEALSGTSPPPTTPSMKMCLQWLLASRAGRSCG